MLGEIVDGEMMLNGAGLVAREVWERLPDHYPHVLLDAFVIMPNHMHGILVLNVNSIMRAGLKPAPTANSDHGVPEIVRAFKTFSSRRINEFQGTRARPVWQRNYYEHIIRNEKTLNAIREYIQRNPSQWNKDPDNPAVIRP
jgi:putative transposase